MLKRRWGGDLVLQALDEVIDEQTFVAFLKILGEDWERELEIEAQHPSSPYGPGALGWENGSIGAFLEAAAASAQDSWKSAKPNNHSGNIWRRCAEIVLGGKVYE